MHDSWHDLAPGLVFRNSPSVLETPDGRRVQLTPLEVSGRSVMAEAPPGTVSAGTVLQSRIRSPQDGSRWLVPVVVGEVHPGPGRADRVVVEVGTPVADSSRRDRERATVDLDVELQTIDGSETQPARLVDISAHGLGLVVSAGATVSCGDRLRVVLEGRLDVVVEVRTIRPRRGEIRIGTRFVELSAEERRDVERRLAGGDDRGDDARRFAS